MQWCFTIYVSAMFISNQIIEKLLESSGSASPEQIEALRDESAHLHRNLQELAVERELIDNKTLLKAYADYSKIPFVEIDAKAILPEIQSQIPERIARQYNAVLFSIDEEGKKCLAMEDPDDVLAVNFLLKELGEDTKIFIATKANILEALDNYRGDVSKELSDVIDVDIQQEEQQEAVKEQDLAEDSPISQTVNLLLEYAVRNLASDVHIEPRDEFIQIRYRIDGILKEVNRLPRNVLNALVSRIKILSNLKIDEHRVPQDGRFKIKVAGKQFALRVSTMPVSDGEKVVMRILDESNQALTLESLGMWGPTLDVFNPSLHVPDGMVLITGPTGSGKSTTLFSALTIINTPDVNITTIEDPVEYRISGVNQTQTNDKAGMTFANGLRALLRQDPNIIMVGEIRDSETAGLGIQAALTGHLVFSTLHTNDAATCLPRLLDMNVEPFLIASTIRSVIGQRLVRKINVKTRITYTPSSEEQEAIKKMFDLSPENFRQIHELEKKAKELGLGEDLPLSTDENSILTLYKADSNDNAGDAHNGYQGRTGIYEGLKVSQNIQKLIMTNASSTELRDQAVKDGMIPMQVDGLIKILRGITTVDEVMRVSKE